MALQSLHHSDDGDDDGEDSRDWALLYRAQMELAPTFEELFEQFASRHSVKFLRPPPSAGEHDLEWSSLHSEYLELFESMLAKWLDAESATAVTFYQECRDSLDDRFCALFEEDINKPFVEQTLALLEYEHFHTLMVADATKRQTLERREDLIARAHERRRGK
tara:strand:+ start:159 stop:647 length:489 start_codon:yes stop_codon:yes gene_type:complete